MSCSLYCARAEQTPALHFFYYYYYDYRGHVTQSELSFNSANKGQSGQPLALSHSPTLCPGVKLAGMPGACSCLPGWEEEEAEEGGLAGPPPVAVPGPGALDTHRDAEPEEGQTDAVGHADRGQEPDFGRRGALVLDVADDLLGCLPVVHLPLHPLMQTAFLQGAIEADQQLYVPAEAGLGQGGQVPQHVVPLPPADPVRVETSVQTVQAVLRVHQQPQRALGGSLPATSDQTPPGQLLELHRHHSAWAVLLDILLETLNSHV